MKSKFTKHGIPYCVMAHSFLQTHFLLLLKDVGLASPRYPQANSEVERGVRTINMQQKRIQKTLIWQCLHITIPHLCCTLSGTLPRTTKQLKAKLPDIGVFQEREKKMKIRMKNNPDTEFKHYLPCALKILYGYKMKVQKLQ